MRKDFAYGVDLGWVSQLEDEGYSWVDDEGRDIDPILACKNMGANAVRLRIFVKPPEDSYWMKHEDEKVMLGCCDIRRVVESAKRAEALDMDLMLDVHYSDHFADPVIQDIPEEWKDDDEDGLTKRVYEHTCDILNAFKDADISPKWFQVGNEVNNGIMWPRGALRENPAALVRFLNAGYDAVKDTCPDCAVITHLAGVDNESWCVPFLENFFARGGKTDILGFSYYPFWAEFKSDKDVLTVWLMRYYKEYGKPLMIAEVGGEDENEQESYATICHAVDAVASIPDDDGLGVFYWEPDAHRSVLPDHYPLGACIPAGDHKLRYTKALKAFLR